jgi:DNA-binding response OmpR family regulator
MAKILVAEDDPQVQELVGTLLDQAGYSVIRALDGAEALDRLRREYFDLLLLDVHMPRLGGLELLGDLRQCLAPPRVVVMTADSSPETVLEAVRGGAYQYLTKPFDPSTLVEVVRAALAVPAPPPIRVISACPNWVELLVPCTIEAADRVQSFLDALEADLSVEVREAVGKAFRELLLNAIEWGGKLNPRDTVRIACLRTSRLLLYRIADPGPGFTDAGLTHAALSNAPDHPTDHERVREQKGLRPGGFGILMAKAMVDEILYNEAHNEVVLLKYLG